MLHAALGLQHRASRLAEAGEVGDAVLYERQAITLLLEATCQVRSDDPALGTVRTLATAGIARIRALKRRAQPVHGPPCEILAKPRRRRASATQSV